MLTSCLWSNLCPTSVVTFPHSLDNLRDDTPSTRHRVMVHCPDSGIVLIQPSESSLPAFSAPQTPQRAGARQRLIHRLTLGQHLPNGLNVQAGLQCQVLTVILALYLVIPLPFLKEDGPLDGSSECKLRDVFLGMQLRVRVNSFAPPIHRGKLL